jgi:hypothetical protein
MSFFTSDGMQHALTQAGFASVEHVGPARAFDRYLRRRTDGARLPAHFRMAKATTRLAELSRRDQVAVPIDRLKGAKNRSKIGPCG